MQYTPDRFNEWLSLDKKGPQSINELMLVGAKEFFSEAAVATNDYVTKKDINAGFDFLYKELQYQQSVIELIEDFAGREGIEVEAVIFVLDQMEEEVVRYLRKHVAEIAKTANARFAE